MKKIIIPTLVLVLALVFVSPVRAADEEKESWFAGFAKFLQMFGLFKDKMPQLEEIHNIKLPPSETFTDDGNESTKELHPPEEGQVKELHPTDVRTTKELHPVESRPTKELHPTDVRTTKEMHPVESRPTKELHPTDVRTTKELHPVESRPTKELHPPEVGPTKGTPELQHEERSDKAHALLTQVLDGYENRLSHYHEFLNKVHSRESKLEQSGADISQLKSYIHTATTNLLEAQQQFHDFEETVNHLDETTDVKTIHDAIRTPHKELQHAMTQLHKSMSESVHTIITTSAKHAASGSTNSDKANTKSNLHPLTTTPTHKSTPVKLH